MTTTFTIKLDLYQSRWCCRKMVNMMSSQPLPLLD